MIKVRGKIQNIISQACIFSDFFLCFFTDLIFIRTCIFSNANFFRTIEVRRKNKFGKKYESKKKIYKSENNSVKSGKRNESPKKR